MLYLSEQVCTPLVRPAVLHPRASFPTFFVHTTLGAPIPIRITSQTSSIASDGDRIGGQILHLRVATLSLLFLLSESFVDQDLEFFCG